MWLIDSCAKKNKAVICFRGGCIYIPHISQLTVHCLRLFVFWRDNISFSCLETNYCTILNSWKKLQIRCISQTFLQHLTRLFSNRKYFSWKSFYFAFSVTFSFTIRIILLNISFDNWSSICPCTYIRVLLLIKANNDILIVFIFKMFSSI